MWLLQELINSINSALYKYPLQSFCARKLHRWPKEEIREETEGVSSESKKGRRVLVSAGSDWCILSPLRYICWMAQQFLADPAFSAPLPQTAHQSFSMLSVPFAGHSLGYAINAGFQQLPMSNLYLHNVCFVF